MRCPQVCAQIRTHHAHQPKQQRTSGRTHYVAGTTKAPSRLATEARALYTTRRGTVHGPHMSENMATHNFSMFWGAHVFAAVVSWYLRGFFAHTLWSGGCMVTTTFSKLLGSSALSPDQ